MPRVSSPQNPRFKETVRLVESSRERRKTGRCVLEGEHLISVYCDRIGPPETLVVVEDVDLCAWSAAFRAGGGHVVALVARAGRNLYDSDIDWPVALAVGNEGAGLSDALCAQADIQVTIPMPGGMESLNAAAAAAIALFECVRRTRTRGSQ